MLRGCGARQSPATVRNDEELVIRSFISVYHAMFGAERVQMKIPGRCTSECTYACTIFSIYLHIGRKYQIRIIHITSVDPQCRMWGSRSRAHPPFCIHCLDPHNISILHSRHFPDDQVTLVALGLHRPHIISITCFVGCLPRGNGYSRGLLDPNITDIAELLIFPLTDITGEIIRQ
jgi:hypothetical protein